MRFFRHRLAVISLVVLILLRARRDLREADRAVRLRRDRPRHTSDRSGADAQGRAHLRHRPARARLPEPGHLRHPHVALGRVLRRDPLDADRHGDRRGRRLLRRHGRQPAHALHRPHPHAAGPRRAAHRGRVPRSDDSTVGPVTISQPMKIGLILALLFWTALARIVRGLFLSLREKEFVEAAKAAGASDMRIIFRHILPNCVGPIIVNDDAHRRARRSSSRRRSRSSASASSRRTPALGKLIADGQSEGFDALVARHVPGADDRAHRALRSTSSATACATRSTRRSGDPRLSLVAEPILSIRDLTVEFDDRGRRRPRRHRRQLRPPPGRDARHRRRVRFGQERLHALGARADPDAARAGSSAARRCTRDATC